MRKNVRCPTCEKEGQSSAVRVDATVKTAMAVHHFYDEEGRFHMHDSNVFQTTYLCSRDHLWSDTRKQSCWCGWPPEHERAPWAIPTLTPYPWPKETPE